MRILQVSEALDFGGAERVEIEYANSLVGIGHSVVLVVPVGLRERFLRYCSSKVEVVPYFPFKKRLSVARIILLRNLCCTYKPDVVHTHESRMCFAMQIHMILRSIKVSHFHTQHLAETWRSNLALMLERLLNSHTNYIAVSSRIREHLLLDKHVRPEKINIVPTIGLARRIIQSEWAQSRTETLRKGLGLGERELILICVGRLTKQKGFEDAIDVAEYLKRHNIDFKMLIVGDGPERKNLDMRIEERSLQNHIVLTGKQSDVAKYLFSADIFLLPSRYEGMPVVLSEAMGAGLVCVCYDVEGVRDLLGESDRGQIVEKNNSTQMAHCIVELSSDRERMRLIGQRASEFIKSYISRHTLAENLCEIYQKQ